MTTTTLTIALTRGRILRETLPLFAAAGIEPRDDIAKSRKLVFECRQAGLRFVVMRGSDVPVYVSLGSADIGVAGKDVLLEHGTGEFYEPVDLGIASCRLMTAAPVGWTPRAGRLRVATKFANIATRHFASRGRQIDLIKLGGALELAPVMGLADVIVDIVDTGKTLRANGLEPREVVAEVTSRLIVNKAAMKMKRETIGRVLDALRQAVAAAGKEP